MIKPAEWDSTEAFTGEVKTITPGGHICKIKQAKVDTTTTGKQVLILIFDIAEGEFKGFYGEQFSKKYLQNPEAKWQGVYRQLTEGNSLKYFKGLISAIENSNPGYKWNWDEKTLKDKLFGGVFGQEEFINNTGDIKLATKCFYARSVDQIKKGVEVPPIKRLKQDEFNPNSFGSEVFPEEEIPF